MKDRNHIYNIPSYLDFKKLNYEQLYSLSKLIRNELIKLSKHKKIHLSSNLGIVELSMGLLYEYDSPKDVILYDTGHQSYVHKMLTNRAHKMDSIRDYNGLSGFQSHKESIHDLISSGHSGSILSIAQGYSENRNNPSNNTIVVIGDAAISNGVCFEALNNIGYNQTPILIVINDNQMSISKNVGAIHNILNQLSSSNQTLNFTNNLLSSKNFFEWMGFKYFYLKQGNNLKKVLQTLNKVKEYSNQMPTILHINTIKGFGFEDAENDVIGKYHSLQIKNLETTLNQDRKQSFSDTKKIDCKKPQNLFNNVVVNFLDKLLQIDNSIKIINPAMTYASGFLEFSERNEFNFEDVGIAEEHAVSKAAGIAITNRKVFVNIYSTFLQRAYDNILHDVARLRLPVVFLLESCDLSYGDGDTHHGIYDIGFLKSIPNTIITAPSNKYEVQKLISLAYENKHNPFFIRYAKDECVDVVQKKEFGFGSWVYVLKNIEAKTCVISYGNMINELNPILSNLRIDLINAIFITYYNVEFVTRILSLYKNVFVVEKVFDSNCLGDDLIKIAFDNKLNCKIQKINIATFEIGFGDKKSIDKKIGIDIDSITKKILEVI
ncbi:MAG: 1-deoxy-D-xylulose-5-phosphate synthase [Malacoplasma sp.]|nr:1-deoxy-D-xylulose-5-phosphate synthase [Malacoplasma sp.]